MMRPGSLFIEDLATADKFTGEGYGSIVRVYVVCKQDRVLPEEFQRRMMKNGGAQHVMEIDGADHMPMFSEPQKLCDCLLEVAAKYAWSAVSFPYLMICIVSPKTVTPLQALCKQMLVE